MIKIYRLYKASRTGRYFIELINCYSLRLSHLFGLSDSDPMDTHHCTRTPNENLFINPYEIGYIVFVLAYLLCLSPFSVLSTFQPFAASPPFLSLVRYEKSFSRIPTMYSHTHRVKSIVCVQSVKWMVYDLYDK